MQVFSGKVRPSGDINTEVVRHDLTPPEIMVLREIHGADSVVNLELRRNDRRQDHVEYERLVKRYSRSGEGRKALTSLFGSPQNPNLPSSLKGFKETASSRVTKKAQGGGNTTANDGTDPGKTRDEKSATETKQAQDGE